MAQQISPTRSMLLASKASLKTATSGADLLTRKRDALIAEFFGVVREALEAREQLSGVSKGAYTSLLTAKAWDSPEAVESLSLAGTGDYAVDMQIESIYGVKVPRINIPERGQQTNFSPINVGARTIQAATDFGSVLNLASETTQVYRVGSLAYMSPEQTGRMNRTVDYRTDFYSLGVTFYELLTGASPFAAASAGLASGSAGSVRSAAAWRPCCSAATKPLRS